MRQSKGKIKVLFFLKYSKNQASSRVRGYYICEELDRRGFNCSILFGYGIVVYINFLLKLLWCDIVYFQKRSTEIDIKFNRLARFLGKKTIFDIDDAPAGVNLSRIGEKKAEEMIKTASIITVGSHKLLDFSKKFNKDSFLIPSSINFDCYKTTGGNKTTDVVTLGWVGNGINYKKDLLMLINPLEKLSKRYNLELVIIGALEQEEIYYNFQALKDINVEIIDSIDWVDCEIVSSALGKFDIGLYPLLNKKYNQYKCGYKALEYMSVGIPVVASPVAENNFIIENGVDGFFASNDVEWEEKISYLIDNREKRKSMGRVAKIKVKKYYSTKIIANNLVEIIMNKVGK